MSPRLSTDGVVVIAGLELDKSFIVFPDNCLAWPKAIFLFGETRQDGMVWAVSLISGALVMSESGSRFSCQT